MSERAAAERPVVLVTGCATGLGLAIAKMLHQDLNFRVAITARGPHLDDLHKRFGTDARFQIMQLDINDENDIYRVVHELCRQWGRIDVVVNNAGLCYSGVVEHMDRESELLQLQTNYLGPMSLVRAVLPIMREQRSGQVINVSSISGLLAIPTMGSYSASKHALEGATEALWYEGRPFGIKVNLIEIGFVKSDAFQRVIPAKKARLSTALSGPHSEFYFNIPPFIEKLMGMSPASAEKVAASIVKTIRRPPGKLRIFATWDAVLFAFVRKLIPSHMFNRAVYFVLPGSDKWGGRWRSKNAPLI